MGKSGILTADTSVRYDEDVHVRGVGREDQADTGDDSPGDGHHATPVAVNQTRSPRDLYVRNVDVKYKQCLLSATYSIRKDYDVKFKVLLHTSRIWTRVQSCISDTWHRCFV